MDKDTIVKASINTVGVRSSFSLSGPRALHISEQVAKKVTEVFGIEAEVVKVSNIYGRNGVSIDMNSHGFMWAVPSAKDLPFLKQVIEPFAKKYSAYLDPTMVDYYPETLNRTLAEAAALLAIRSPGDSFQTVSGIPCSPHRRALIELVNILQDERERDK